MSLRESSGFPRSMSLGVVPVVEHLPTEELDSVSPLVLLPIFDGDNLKYYPRRWVGLWTEEEDGLLSRVLRVGHRAIQRPFLASGDLARVGVSIYAVVVHREPMPRRPCLTLFTVDSLRYEHLHGVRMGARGVELVYGHVARVR